MDFKIVPFAELDDVDLERITVAHHSVMKTLLTDLGLPIVLKYYQVAREESSVIGFGAFSQAGELLGWAVGSPRPDVLNLKLRKPLLWFTAHMVRLAFTHPIILSQIISSVLSTSINLALDESTLELTYIGVMPEQRGKGFGRELLNVFIEASHKAGYHFIELSVEVDNEPAIALYKRTGFQIVQTFSEGRYQRHRMELKIQYETIPAKN